MCFGKLSVDELLTRLLLHAKGDWIFLLPQGTLPERKYYFALCCPVQMFKRPFKSPCVRDIQFFTSVISPVMFVSIMLASMMVGVCMRSCV